MSARFESLVLAALEGRGAVRAEELKAEGVVNAEAWLTRIYRGETTKKVAVKGIKRANKAAR